MEKSGTEAVADTIEDTSMNKTTNNTGNTASEALKEWIKNNKKAQKEQPKGLPKRNPDRDVSRNGNQKVRLSPKRHDWRREPVRWSIRANNPHLTRLEARAKEIAKVSPSTARAYLKHMETKPKP